ncbi:MAG: cytochrome D1 domain-containing protein [bacterium]
MRSFKIIISILFAVSFANICNAGAAVKPVNVKNLIAVVEGGTGKVWIMKGTKILDKFNFGDIHGGLKYSPSGRYLYLPSDTGYIGKYDFYRGKLVYKVRACRYLRNISLSEGGRYVLAACWLPKSIVVLNSKNLEPKKIIPLNHRVSVIYGLFRNNKAVFSFMHKPCIGILNTDTFNLSYYKIPVPFQDFFVDPLDEYAVGGSFNRGELYVFSLKDKKIVWRHSSNGIAHPAGVGFWFHKGKFYFALTSLNAPYVSVWRMYDWKFIKNVFTGGPGFFVKTNPYTKYLWVDNSSDADVLINKYNFHTKKLVIKHKGNVIHTQFSGNEKLAYISLYGTHGELAVAGVNSLKVIKKIPANDVIGKYNYVNYQRMNDAALLGEEVYFTYCWGCHNPTLQSIGPSFAYIASHLNDFGIKKQLADPQEFSKKLGYEYNAMPKFNLSGNEVKALIAFIKDSGNRNFWRNGN